MNMHKARERLRWRGAETVREIAKRISRQEPSIVLLPHGLHHAVCVRTGADERSHGLIELPLDAEGFERLTRITALHELDALREQLKRGAISVRVRTPPPQLVVVPLPTGRREAMHQHHWSPAAALAKGASVDETVAHRSVEDARQRSPDALIGSMRRDEVS